MVVMFQVSIGELLKVYVIFLGVCILRHTKYLKFCPFPTPISIVIIRHTYRKQFFHHFFKPKHWSTQLILLIITALQWPKSLSIVHTSLTKVYSYKVRYVYDMWKILSFKNESITEQIKIVSMREQNWNTTSSSQNMAESVFFFVRYEIWFGDWRFSYEQTQFWV